MIRQVYKEIVHIYIYAYILLFGCLHYYDHIMFFINNYKKGNSKNIKDKIKVDIELACKLVDGLSPTD